MGLYGPLKLIRIGDEFLVKFGGHPGYDSKIVLKRPHERRHYTISIRDAMTYEDLGAVPFNAHLTDEGPPKSYTSLARGSFDFGRLFRDVTTGFGPNPKREDFVRQVDLETPELKTREVVPITPQFMEMFGRKELLLTEDVGDRFQPTTVRELRAQAERKLAMSFPLGEGHKDEGILIMAGDLGYEVRLPPQVTRLFSGADKLGDYMNLEYLDPIEGLEDDGEGESDEEEI